MEEWRMATTSQHTMTTAEEQEQDETRSDAVLLVQGTGAGSKLAIGAIKTMISGR